MPFKEGEQPEEPKFEPEPTLDVEAKQPENLEDKVDKIKEALKKIEELNVYDEVREDVKPLMHVLGTDGFRFVGSSVKEITDKIKDRLENKKYDKLTQFLSGDVSSVVPRPKKVGVKGSYDAMVYNLKEKIARIILKNIQDSI